MGTQSTAEFIAGLRAALRAQREDGGGRSADRVAIDECARCGRIAGADPITWGALNSCAAGNSRVAAHLCECPRG